MVELAAASVPNLAVYAGAAAAVIGAILAILRFSPERRGLLITNEQGAAQLRDAHIEALQRDLERKNEELARQDRRIAQVEQQLEGERAKNAALIERFGTREDDRNST